MSPPRNQPSKVGACCTYYGDSFWTGAPEPEHTVGGWKWWTPIQPYYGSRAIALHQHTEVTGQPIGHGCVRMENDNAKRIHDFSNGRRTNVTIDGRAAPVDCRKERQCAGSSAQQINDSLSEETTMVNNSALQEPVEGLEGMLT